MPDQPLARFNGALFVVLVSLMMLLSLVPGALANIGTFGSQVGSSSTDTDLTGLLLLTPGGALMFNDADGSGGYNCPTTTTCDPIYLHFAGTNSVAAGDIRLSHSTITEGDHVETSDTDFGNALLALPSGGGLTGLAFEDIYPDAACPTGGGSGPPCGGLYNLGEPLYIDTEAPGAGGNGVVSAGDVKILSQSSSQNTSASSSFTMVTGSDSRAGNALTGLTAAHAGAQIAALDANGDAAYNIGDGVFIDVNGDNMANPGEVRISPFGSQSSTQAEQIEVSDRISVQTLTAGGPARFAFNDADTDGIVDDNEQVFIDVDGAGPVARFDVVIGPVTSGSSTSTGAGDQVDAGDAELGVALAVIPLANIKFNDKNANGVFDAEDALYIDINNANAQVEAGDLLLSRGTSGTGTVGDRVDAGDTEIGDPLTGGGTAPAPTFVDFNGGGYGLQDAFYLDWDGNGVVSPGDTRVSKGKTPMTSFGETVDDGNSDTNLCYRFAFTGADVRWLDEGTAATVNLEEALYLDRGGDGTISPLDLRLSTGSGEAAGTYVQTGDTDQGNGLTAFAAPPPPIRPFMFHDSNGDGSYSIGVDTGDEDDAVYIDVTNAGAATTIAVGDTHITDGATTNAGSAGEKVTSGDDDSNLPMSPLPAGFTISALDRDGDGTFGLDDEIYINVDAAARGAAIADAGLTAAGALGCPTPGDIRISGSGGATSTTTPTGGGGGSGGGGTGGTPTSTPASVSINTPSNGAYVETGSSFTISGSASAGTGSGLSVSLTVAGESVAVSGTSSWSATYTPASDGSYTITATAQSSSGTRSASVTVTANAEGEAPDADDDGVLDGNDDCPNQAGPASNNGCPETVVDEQAREDAAEAQQTAEEARDAANQAQETAQEARDAANEARNASQQNSEGLDQILEAVRERQEGENGTPGPGALGALVAVALAMLVARRQRR